MRIALVTRSLTRNQGNVALSLAWKSILQQQFAASEVMVFERIPSRLKRYTLDIFASRADPIASFDDAARKLRPGGTWFPREFTGDTIRLDRRGAQRNPSKFRAKLNIRARLAKLGLFDGEFADRQTALAKCDLMVMNAAGEFLPRLTDTPLQYLLDLRAAQFMGLKTAFVNTSFETSDPLVLRLAVHVLDKVDLLVFRDAASKRRYRDAGGKADAHVIADVAMLHGDVMAPSPPTKRAAISLSARLSDGQTSHDDWRELALALRAGDLEPVFISNEWLTDEPIFDPWVTIDGLSAEGKGLDVDDYVRMLAGFDVVVSARLHTCVLAMLAGTPVIPIEMETSKISGFFEQIELPANPVYPGADWVAETSDRAIATANDKQSIAESQGAILVAAQDRLRAELAMLLKPLA